MVGRDNLLYRSTNYVALANGGNVYHNETLDGPWTIGTGGGITSITQLNDGSFAGVAGGLIYTKNELSTSSAWMKAGNPPNMEQLIELKDGTFICIANGGRTYNSNFMNRDWVPGYMDNALQIGRCAKIHQE